MGVVTATSNLIREMSGPRVVVTEGPDRGRIFELGPRTNFIGRDRDCHVRISDAMASRRHAVLRWMESYFEIEDLGSCNGTRVNGAIVGKRQLSPGDTVNIGRTAMSFRAGRNVDGHEIGAEPTDTKKVALAGDGYHIQWPDDPKDIESLLRSRSDLEALYRLSTTIGAILETTSLIPKILDIIFDEVDVVDRCTLLLRDEETGELVCTAARSGSRVPFSHAMVFSRQMVEQVVRDKKALLSIDAKNDERFRKGESIQAHGIRSAVCAPLVGQGGVIGVIYADTIGLAREFSQDDLRLIAAIGISSGAALENARLYEKVTQDVEDLEDANARLRAAQERLLQSEKLAAIGQLAAGIIHDVKNPMTVILGYTRVLREGLEAAASDPAAVLRMDDDLREIEQGVIHSNEVLNSLLMFAKPSKIGADPLDINVLVEDTLKFVRHRIQSQNVQVTTELGTDIPRIPADASQLKQVFMNLVLNAVDAMDKPEKKLRVRTSLVMEEDGTMLRIEFTDNGKGMSDEQRRRVFDPFYSTKTDGRTSGGMGLGLSICLSIVNRHQGHIDVQSTPGVGTTFSVLIPAPALTDAGPDVTQLIRV